jgi:hypothetical protein
MPPVARRAPTLPTSGGKPALPAPPRFEPIVNPRVLAFGIAGLLVLGAIGLVVLGFSLP